MTDTTDGEGKSSSKKRKTKKNNEEMMMCDSEEEQGRELSLFFLPSHSLVCVFLQNSSSPTRLPFNRHTNTTDRRKPYTRNTSTKPPTPLLRAP